MAFTGHVGHTGHTGHTGHRRLADDASPGGLEAYAGEDISPLLVDALVQPVSEEWSFDALGQPDQAAPLDQRIRAVWGGPPGELPDPKNVAQAQQRFWRSAPTPRAEICFAQLFGNLCFSEANDGKGLALQVRSGAGDPRPLITLTRPGYDVFKAHLGEVQENDSRLRRDRAPEILTQLQPAEAVWSSITGLNGNRFPRTLELIDIALDVTVPVVYRFKQHFLCPRPFEYSSQIRPVVLTPSHDSWPSGHSTEAHVTARLLSILAAQCGDGTWAAATKERLFESALRIAQNRQVAGLHFPTDTSVGRVLGDTLARYVAAVGDPANQAAVRAREFDAPKFYKDNLLADRNASTDLDAGFDVVGGAPFWDQPPAFPAHASYFQWLWAKAVDEWRQA